MEYNELIAGVCVEVCQQYQTNAFILILLKDINLLKKTMESTRAYNIVE